MNNIHNEELIAVAAWCAHYNVDAGFVTALQQSGMLQIISKENQHFILEQELPRAELLRRLHRDLGLPTDSMDIVCNLLDRMSTMQLEIMQLRNRLRLYDH